MSLIEHQVGVLRKQLDTERGRLAHLISRAREYESQPDLVRNIIHEGNERARDVARETMEEVRHAMSLSYR